MSSGLHAPSPFCRQKEREESSAQSSVSVVLFITSWGKGDAKRLQPELCRTQEAFCHRRCSYSASLADCDI